MSDDKLNSIEEHAIDAMLAETLGNAAPPDLSESILRQLGDEFPGIESVVGHPRTAASRRPAVTLPPSEQRPRKRVAIVVAVIGSLAACFVAALSLRFDAQDARSTASMPDAEQSSDLSVDSSDNSLARNLSPRVSEPENNQNATPPRGIPLVLDSQPDQEDRESRIGEVVVEALSKGSGSDPLSNPAELRLVSRVAQQVDQQLQSYWQAIGVAPTGEATAEQISARLQPLLGIALPADVVSNPQQLQALLRQSSVASQIGRQWLIEVTDGGLRRLPEPAREGLIADVASTLRGDRPLDAMLGQWIDGSSEQSAAFYAAMRAGYAGANDRHAMVRRLGSLTMNVDLRCTRCHDAFIDSKGSQRNYWSFAGFVDRKIKREGVDSVQVDPESQSDKPIFFETLDKRQQATQAKVAAEWLSGTSGQPITSVQQWARTLEGSRSLARGVVNSLWSLVHGQRLSNRVIDPLSAPAHETLQAMEDELVEDLVQSQFDVARTLSLIIASPATRRAVPEVLLADNALLAPQQEIDRALSKVDAFAAAMPTRRSSLAMNQRLDQVLRAAGASLDSSGQPFVAQIDEANGSGQGKQGQAKQNRLKSLAGDFPLAADQPPVQWLESIEDPKEQIAHLAYLAGLTKVPEQAYRAAEVTEDAENRNLALHRVWWLLKK